MPKKRLTVLDSLNTGLHKALSADRRVILLGEDILDPYGGAFKATRGLSSEFPDRVWATPISEAGMVGIAAGMAMRGFLPVVEIMFGDFLTLAADQIVNHIAKFHWMYSGGKTPSEQVFTPLVIRTPMGGRRGYGPTHSQTIEKLFLGVPGLRVVAPNNLAPDALGIPGDLLFQVIVLDPDPVLFIENKLLYLLPVQTDEMLAEWHIVNYIPISPLHDPQNRHPSNGTNQNQQPVYPTHILTLRDAPPAQITLTAYGYMTELVRQAALHLAYEFEIFTEIVIPTQLAPFDLAPLYTSVRKTRRLLAIEEGNLTLGWGAEILARTTEHLGSVIRSAQRLAAKDHPVPASGPLEHAALPGINQIIEKCLEIIRPG